MSFAAEEVWRGGDGTRFSAPAAASWRRGGARLANAREEKQNDGKQDLAGSPRET
jgi:hypothetical protein